MTARRRLGSVAALLAAVVWLAAATRSRVVDGQSPTTRHYYIAAEHVVWDYAPSGRNAMGHGAETGIPAPWRGQTRWSKVRYVEYTDESFTTRKPQAPSLGILGPVLRAEVGDTIVVHFWNRADGHYSVHPHGLRYTKDHEGAHYVPAGAGARVAPGARFTYTWTADADSGPGAGDPSSIVWWYHSHVDEPADVNLGLLGPLVVTARGRARPDATPIDVDRELFVLMMIFDEAKGAEHGQMHSINGALFGNLPFEARLGERVRWYLLGMGNEKDLHTAHWHGKTLTVGRRRTDVVELLPGSMATADMVADNPGTWLLHCHVADHLNAGMFTTYSITP
jgi:FtsP/CotA-like multicopper oxidase with cupredoxin domain